MANRWGNSGNSERLNFGGSKITADGDYSHEIKMLAPWKKSYVQPRQHIEKQRHFGNKVPSSQSYSFSVVRYGCESWAVKKAESGELMLLNCGVGEDSWESLGQQGDPTSPS